MSLCAGDKNDGSPGRTRTSDTVVNSHLLYQLSYRGSDVLYYKGDWIVSRVQFWRPEPESNRRTRFCRPLHNHSVIGPCLVKGWIRSMMAQEHRISKRKEDG